MKVNRIAMIIGCAIYMLLCSSGVRATWIRSFANTDVMKALLVEGPDQTLLYPLGANSAPKKPELTFGAWRLDGCSPYLQGLVALRIRDLARAEKMFASSLQRQVHSVLDLYALGVARYLQAKDSVELWKRANCAVRFLIAAGELTNAGRSDKAEIYFRFALLVVLPTDRAGFRQLLLYFASGNDEKCFTEALNGYLKTNGASSSESHWILGTAFLTHGEAARALPHLNIVLASDPDNAGIRYLIGQALVATGRFDEARASFDKAIQFAPGDPNPYTYKGHSFLHQGRFSEAAEWYGRALVVAPENVWALTCLAQVRISQARYVEALQISNRAMKRDRQPHVMILAATAAAKLEKWTLSREYLLEALAADPGNLQALLLLGDICEAVGDIGCLRKTYGEILCLDPQNVRAQRRLGEIERSRQLPE